MRPQDLLDEHGGGGRAGLARKLLAGSNQPNPTPPPTLSGWEVYKQHVIDANYWTRNPEIRQQAGWTLGQRLALHPRGPGGGGVLGLAAK